MGLTKQDREFRLPKITYVDFKQIEMDRVLTAFFQRLKHNGYPSKLIRPPRFELTTKDFQAVFFENPERFHGFQHHREVTARWIETHLMDVVNRGKHDQAIAAPRPLHGLTYLFRNPERSRDYNASQQLYEMLYNARTGGTAALDHLRSFFFSGYDLKVDQVDRGATLDVETQALLNLETLVNIQDAKDDRLPRESYPALCIGAADLLAEDIQRILYYGHLIPRSVMVEYIKILFAFHLALFYLRLFKLLPALVRRHGSDPVCDACPMRPREFFEPQGGCPHQIGLLLDVAGRINTPIARLAEKNADAHYRRMAAFIKASFITRKLNEFAEDLRKVGKLPPPPPGGFYTVGQVLQLQRPQYEQDRKTYFGQRIFRLVQEVSSANDVVLDPEIQTILKLDLPEFEKYIEVLVALRGNFHRRYITDCLDSLLMKNRPGALIAQPKRGARRFILDGRLLEVLLQIAVLQQDAAGVYRTTEIRIDNLLAFLRQRYGLYIDRLPAGDGFGPPSIDDRQALLDNLDEFKKRLREVGYYRDLSDAYVTQTIIPRYQIGANEAEPAPPLPMRNNGQGGQG
jgi:hypothetical protein